MLPSRYASISRLVEVFPETSLDWFRACILVIHPGVQKPHCVPLFATRRFCSWERSSLWVDPMPSTVVTARPSFAHSGLKHELTDTIPSGFVRTTVQAPQPPSSQPSLVPFRPTFSRIKVTSSSDGSGFVRVMLFPLTNIVSTLDHWMSFMLNDLVHVSSVADRSGSLSSSSFSDRMSRLKNPRKTYASTPPTIPIRAARNMGAGIMVPFF
jgi:hypothetical protein